MRLTASEVPDVRRQLRRTRNPRRRRRIRCRPVPPEAGGPAADSAKVPIAMLPGGSARGAPSAAVHRSLTARSCDQCRRARAEPSVASAPARAPRPASVGAARGAWLGRAPPGATRQTTRRRRAAPRTAAAARCPDPRQARPRSPAAPARTSQAPRPAAPPPQEPASAAPRAAPAAGAPSPGRAAPVTTCAALPHARSASTRSSVVSSRSSAARSACVSSSGDGRTSASSGPRHSLSASPSSLAARSGSADGQRGPAARRRATRTPGSPGLPASHAQQVAGRPVDEHLALGVAEDLFAQPVHVDADHVVRRARRAYRPTARTSGSRST